MAQPCAGTRETTYLAQVDVLVRGEVKGGLGLNHDWARVPTHVATVRTRFKVCCT